MSDEITITLTSLRSNRTESISVSLSTTTLPELCEFAVALLGLRTADGLILSKDGKQLFFNSSQSKTLNKSVSTAGIQNGDLIVVMPPSSKKSTRRAAASASSSSAAPPNSGGLSLDFSSLLGGGQTQTSSATSATSASNGLTFHLPMLSNTSLNEKKPVQWPKMTLDDCISRNPNPDNFVQVLLDEQNHPNLIKELNYHSPRLATRLKAAGPQGASTIWRQEMQKKTMSSHLNETLISQKETEMKHRLRLNPMDEEANAYFGKQIQKENVDAQYRQMMEENPESMGRVLMLYIDAEVNNHHIQAFVDSGAQATIMSSNCADRCGLLHLLDTRFEGTAVGVGTGKILGRIHIAEMKVQGHIFPCTITIMDSEKGLGDKNMDFLLGLDMLKRHRCNIDLGRNVLVFCLGGTQMETPFLHEKDLPEAKGGTMDFDAEKNNANVQKKVMEED